jgi:hypothetical protein
MFISFSKTIAKFGGFRVGIGTRLSKKNAVWLSWLFLFVAIFKLMWYMLLLYGWLIYAMCYGMYWCIKKIYRACSPKKIKAKSATTVKTERFVYITLKGKKFHYDVLCPGLRQSKEIKMELSKAREAGYTACDKCCYSYLHE